MFSKKDAYNLFHRATLVLVKLEANGMKIDIDKVRNSIELCKRKKERYRKKVMKTETGIMWQRQFGSNLNLFSPQQLGVMLYDVMKYPVKKRTDKGTPQTDVTALTDIQGDFSDYFILMKKYEKLVGTYLGNLLIEEVNGRVHSFFNLHTTKSFRSSMSNLNLQNIPARDPITTPLIRECFVAGTGNRVVEVDFSQLEVRTSCSYHKDPNMISYINNPESDMHTDTAADIFKVAKSDVSKVCRFYAKNKFVFAAFYGSYYKQIAEDMWGAIKRGEVTGNDGESILNHLRSQDIGTYAAFETHLKEVERIFWEERFQVYAEWKGVNRKKYTRYGKLTSHTGFNYTCFMSNNDSSNWANQGTASNICVWCICEIQDAIEERGLKTLIVNTVHDSIIFDMPDEEMQEIFNLCHEVMTVRVMKHFKFLNVPLEIEIETSPVNGSWGQKKESSCVDGEWVDPHNPTKE